MRTTSLVTWDRQRWGSNGDRGSGAQEEEEEERGGGGGETGVGGMGLGPGVRAG